MGIFGLIAMHCSFIFFGDSISQGLHANFDLKVPQLSYSQQGTQPSDIFDDIKDFSFAKNKGCNAAVIAVGTNSIVPDRKYRWDDTYSGILSQAGQQWEFVKKLSDRDDVDAVYVVFPEVAVFGPRNKLLSMDRNTRAYRNHLRYLSVFEKWTSKTRIKVEFIENDLPFGAFIHDGIHMKTRGYRILGRKILKQHFKNFHKIITEVKNKKDKSNQ